jgi:predicted CXXCH cytochrome family protein
VRCHGDRNDAFSHPLNIVPEMCLPAEMPLENGRMACLTCHFAHSQNVEERPRNRALLRKSGRGVHFCSSCHGLRASDHCVYEFAHRASSRSLPQSGTLDSHSLQCIECHDRHATRVSRSTGGGRWQPFDSTRSNHPVGISYAQVAARFPRAYTPAATLPQQLRLYNDQIGCGTCHSAYSNAKFMLTVDNSGSRLCLSCHVK